MPPRDSVPNGSSSTISVSEVPPLRNLWRHARNHRSKVVFATVMSVVNKICDIAPELLIGAAVDVVVNERQSFVGPGDRLRRPVRAAHVCWPS